MLYRHYMGPDDDDLAWVNFCLAKAEFELSHIPEAVAYIHEADNFYAVIPGKDHPFYTQDFAPEKAKIIS